jgi:hypothetical protein
MLLSVMMTMVMMMSRIAAAAAMYLIHHRANHIDWPSVDVALLADDSVDNQICGYTDGNRAAIGFRLVRSANHHCARQCDCSRSGEDFLHVPSIS